MAGHAVVELPWMSLYTRYFFKRCPNGHMLYWEEGNSAEDDTSCWKCGDPYLIHCPSCNAQLGNAFDAMKTVSDGKPWSFPKRPAFCGKCGTPYPWTATEHQAIEDSGFWSLLHPMVVKLVWCLTNTVMKMRGHFGCRQGAMTCRGGFQTRPCGRYHARKSNAADGQKDPQIHKRICETPH